MRRKKLAKTRFLNFMVV